MIKSAVAKLGYRIWERRLPKVITLADFDPRGVRFEAASPHELRRIVNRGYEPDYLGAMVAALTPSDVLYDIGANIGLVALHAGCRTVAFEPDPGFFGRLERNIELNPSAAVDARQLAISDTDGTVTLFTDGADGTSPSLVHQRGERDTVDVEAQTLDTLVESGGLPAPTVLKLDIEGAEILALRGARRLLHGPNPPRLLFLEVHDALLPAFGSTADEVIGLARVAGYETVRYEAKRAHEQHLIVGRRTAATSDIVAA